MTSKENFSQVLTALERLGFERERESPGSGYLSLYLPAGRSILISNRMGGDWPEDPADGISAGLYDSDGHPVITVSDETVTVEEVLATVTAWAKG